MIFVDTGAWFAIAVREDSCHDAATTFLNENAEPLVTSDQVVIETMNLIRFRSRTSKGHHLANRVGDDLWKQRAAVLVGISADDIESARVIFRRYGDKVWSFTDCSSFAIMDRLGIEVAFAFDENFTQYGFQTVP